ncbi:MAG: hypothetical protein IPO48_19995 [Saprospiraceae bacterium]|nr:hypothetical protein [Saprospiraceae bacterium]
MAEALSFFSGIKFGVGPAIDNGYYYDVDTGDTTPSTSGFSKIEENA